MPTGLSEFLLVLESTGGDFAPSYDITRRCYMLQGPRMLISHRFQLRL